MTSTLIISFDFELGWGVLDSPAWKAREESGLFRRMRTVVPELIQNLHALEIPSTWATVSSMLVEHEADLPVDHLPDDYRSAVLEFFRMAEWTTRCAADLFEEWQKIQPISELASHTATHLYVTCPGVSSEHYVRDVEESFKVLDHLGGVPVKSLVFTRDQADYHEQVAALRPLAVRVPPAVYGARGGRWTRVFRGAKRFFSAIPPTTLVDQGTYGTTQSGSLYFNWSGGDFERLKRLQVDLQSRRLLSQMSSGSESYHLWLHPFNLAESPRHMERFLRFLKGAATLRDQGRLRILTMGDFAGS